MERRPTKLIEALATGLPHWEPGYPMSPKDMYQLEMHQSALGLLPTAALTSGYGLFSTDVSKAAVKVEWKHERCASVDKVSYKLKVHHCTGLTYQRRWLFMPNPVEQLFTFDKDETVPLYVMLSQSATPKRVEAPVDEENAGSSHFKRMWRVAHFHLDCQPLRSEEERLVCIQGDHLLLTKLVYDPKSKLYEIDPSFVPPAVRLDDHPAWRAGLKRLVSQAETQARALHLPYSPLLQKSHIFANTMLWLQGITSTGWSPRCTTDQWLNEVTCQLLRLLGQLKLHQEYWMTVERHEHQMEVDEALRTMSHLRALSDTYEALVPFAQGAPALDYSNAFELLERALRFVGQLQHNLIAFPEGEHKVPPARMFDVTSFDGQLVCEPLTTQPHFFEYELKGKKQGYQLRLGAKELTGESGPDWQRLHKVCIVFSFATKAARDDIQQHPPALSWQTTNCERWRTEGLFLPERELHHYADASGYMGVLIDLSKVKWNNSRKQTLALRIESPHCPTEVMCYRDYRPPTPTPRPRSTQQATPHIVERSGNKWW